MMAVFVTCTTISWFSTTFMPCTSLRYKKAFRPSPMVTKAALIPGNTLSTLAL